MKKKIVQVKIPGNILLAGGYAILSKKGRGISLTVDAYYTVTA